MTEIKTVRVRFAPSPTGYLHIGGARTALFNWMYAKATGGKFILRIEDTDQQRSKKEFEEEILKSMKWLGMDWDELYYQAQRFDIYRQHAQNLVDEGKAYQDKGAILLKMQKKEVKIYDLIRDEITFDTANFILRDANDHPVLNEKGETQLKDEVLIKSDGSPAYSFCCAVDDALMDISCVIRGEDHISNTPKQILMQEAMGFKPPKYAHLPLIMDQNGGRLSKRTGAVAVSDYKKEGFLPEAIVNYLLLLGWSPGNNQEIINLKSAVKQFSIKKVNKTAAAFSMDKLKWINNQYLKQKPTEEVEALIIPLLKEKNLIGDNYDSQLLTKSVELYKGRLSTLNDFWDWADYFFTDQFIIDAEAKEKYALNSYVADFKRMAEKIKSTPMFNAQSAEESLKDTAKEMNKDAKDLVHPVRVALTGKSIGPSLFAIMDILGKEKVIERLNSYSQ